MTEIIFNEIQEAFIVPPDVVYSNSRVAAHAPPTNAASHSLLTIYYFYIDVHNIACVTTLAVIYSPFQKQP